MGSSPRDDSDNKDITYGFYDFRQHTEINTADETRNGVRSRSTFTKSNPASSVLLTHGG
ncbi:hypothetical protein [Haloquadratum walsbyi]|uniref:hypothetical protein n=1 Tax=Haloquadratum walsbyi TaxID=293091 RepID=UPI0023F0CB79|nr:hypothetical protein [Haloquadratum walsbyi]